MPQQKLCKVLGDARMIMEGKTDGLIIPLCKLKVPSCLKQSLLPIRKGAYIELGELSLAAFLLKETWEWKSLPYRRDKRGHSESANDIMCI